MADAEVAGPSRVDVEWNSEWTARRDHEQFALVTRVASPDGRLMEFGTQITGARNLARRLMEMLPSEQIVSLVSIREVA